MSYKIALLFCTTFYLFSSTLETTQRIKTKKNNFGHTFIHSKQEREKSQDNFLKNELKKPKKRIKKIKPIRVLFFYDPQDEHFRIDSDGNLKILRQTIAESVIIDLQKKDTDEIVCVEKK